MPNTATTAKVLTATELGFHVSAVPVTARYEGLQLPKRGAYVLDDTSSPVRVGHNMGQINKL